MIQKLLIFLTLALLPLPLFAADEGTYNSDLAFYPLEEVDLGNVYTDRLNTEGYVVGSRTCEPCRTKILCTLCPGNYLEVTDAAPQAGKYVPSRKSRVLRFYTTDPSGMIRGAKYRFSIYKSKTRDLYELTGFKRIP